MQSPKQYVGILIFLFGVLALVYSVYFYFGSGKEDIEAIKNNGTVAVMTDDELKDLEGGKDTDEEIVKDLFENTEEEGDIKDEEIEGNPVLETIEEIENEPEVVDPVVEEEDIEEEEVIEITPEEEVVAPIEETPVEEVSNVPGDVIIGNQVGYLQDVNETLEISNIYEILGFEADYPVYLFDGDINISGLSDKNYSDEFKRIKEQIELLDGTAVQTNLFGDKQFFINIPTYYKKKVVMYIESASVNYIVILDYDIYQAKKEFLGNLFSK